MGDEEKNGIRNLNEFVQKRVEENEKLFTKDELKLIRDNKTIFKKIYLLGLVDSKEINS